MVLFAAVSSTSANMTDPADPDIIAREVRAAIVQAYKDSGLGQLIRKPDGKVILYGMVLEGREIQSVVPSMLDFLAGSLVTTPGPAVVRVKVLRSSLAAMARMLEAFVTNPVGPTLTPEQCRRWSVIVSKLQSVLRSVDRQEVDALVLPRMLLDRLQSALDVDANDIPDITKDAHFAPMVSILLSFLTEQAKVRLRPRRTLFTYLASRSYRRSTW